MFVTRSSRFRNQLASHPVVYAVMTFGMRVKTVQKFTSDPGKLDEALERIARDAPNGLSTHTYDAVDDAIRMLVKVRRERARSV